jgi:hypothetical protein
MSARETGTAKLAASLLEETLRLYRDVPEEGRAPSLQAIDFFLAAPSPSRFMRATRQIRAAVHRARLAASGNVLARRQLDRALSGLQEVPSLDADMRAQLQALPVDVQASRRLDALCALLSAHDELTARVRSRKEYKLDPLPPVRGPRPANFIGGPRKRRRG